MLTINERCDGCGHCVEICPADGAIGAGQPYWINPDRCAECGACVNECPVQAIAEA
jgi:NAD-dependent dihydropyrimidine dehydrogenase PreA subunit